MTDKFDTNRGNGTDFLSMYIAQTYNSPQFNGHPSEINFTPSPQKQASYSRVNMNGYNHESVTNGNVFCHQDNLTECVGFLNQELTSIGLPSLYEGGADSYDPARLVNCTYDLLQKYGQMARLREELENRIRRQEADISHQRETQRSLMRQLDQSQQETVQAQERERQLTNKNKTLSNKLKAEREEVKRLQSVIQHRDTQYKHEVRKKERESTKLKDRLHHMLSDKKGGKMGIDISSVLTRPGGKRSQWTTGNKQEEELYRQVISNYEEKQKELLVENSGLRQGLIDLQREVVRAFRESPPDQIGVSSSTQELLYEDDENLSDDYGDNEEGTQDDEHFQMPYEYLESNLLKTAKEKCRQMRRYMQLIEKKQLEVSSRAEKSPVRSESKQKQNEMEKLRRDIQRYKEIIDEQDQMIQKAAIEGGSDTIGKNFLNESDIAKEKEYLEFQKQLFDEQKSNFDQERQTYNEATLRLHKDKQKLEHEKVSMMQKEFSMLTPFQKKVQHNPPKRSLPTTPSVQSSRNPAQHASQTPEYPRHVLTTPTTRELYRHLRLISEDEDDASHTRPKSAETSDPYRGSRSSHALSPAWANSGRRRPSTAVAKTSPSGESAWTSHTSSSSTSVSDHMDNIKMMLFSQHGQAVQGDAAD